METSRAVIEINSTQSKGRRGGARPGAGRPKGAKSATTKELEALAKELAPIALHALKGVATKGKSESARVQAATALLDRGFGRPRQSIEHSGPEGGPIETAQVEARAKLTSRIEGLASRIAPMPAPVLAATNGNGHTNGNGNGHHAP